MEYFVTTRHKGEVTRKTFTYSDAAQQYYSHQCAYFFVKAESEELSMRVTLADETRNLKTMHIDTTN